MATIQNNQRDSEISSDALSLLDCFSGDFDEMIYRLAEHAAIERIGHSGTIEVIPEDIQSAAQRFAKIMKTSDVPDDVKAEIDAMLDCVSEKTKRHK